MWEEGLLVLKGPQLCFTRSPESPTGRSPGTQIPAVGLFSPLASLAGQAEWRQKARPSRTRARSVCHSSESVTRRRRALVAFCKNEEATAAQSAVLGTAVSPLLPRHKGSQQSHMGQPHCSLCPTGRPCVGPLQEYRPEAGPWLGKRGSEMDALGEPRGFFEPLDPLPTGARLKKPTPPPCS